ncbi:hypothetical protein O6H91_01G024400 [Diphasiastrum complanatum]|uniref:Uncharacterized protein n=8 Tax=Diphasiastrum complanatum TaxID=34168 RepID=A0ACC2EP98_DIPCM|nr:hypothetical protein O6H91_Y404200 [Diphasiastrum complanatum]KAJ7264423.1 hypothetical protein O6H91_Y404200 [Diphasiastrum complanatum]KAJ7264424.1 hypothetical protein O6H91_Y404200 [Diphasiastrum complanatum]KAJ7264425.1 hypothetical protein O6H91_Y404200 [Diphasiastrum complanatum]KAJ7264426.1 hypothetical protein O6H91_Y404200 [Diphasiastrum complanatum]
MTMSSTDPEAQPLLASAKSSVTDEGRRAIPQRLGSSSEERAYEKNEMIDVFAYDQELRAVEQGGFKFSWKRLWLFTGPGLLMSIAYLDPGNIESDLQSGAAGGYSLLWLLLMSTLMGLVIQLLSAKVGVATGYHLAELCRMEYPFTARIVLWIMTEVAIIGADIQEVIGSAIAFRILSNGFIPLWAGVLMTGFSGFLFLFLENFGVRKLEAFFAVLIAIMAISFAWVFGKAGPDMKQIFSGLVTPYVPQHAVGKAVGIVGALIMPHNIFLHSALVQSRSIDANSPEHVEEAFHYYSIESSIALTISFVINLFITTVFAKGFYGTPKADIVGLANAGEYLQEKYGGGMFPILYIWAIGLLAAGQSSTMTGTYTGQFVMAGFLNLRVKKWVRVIVTRSVAIVPTILVALLFDTSQNKLDQMNEWLNVLQSVQLPFALIPLFSVVANERIMGIFKIGPIMKVVTGLIAIVVLTINAYLLGTFFFSGTINSFSTILPLSLVAFLYFGFVLYLVLKPMHADKVWTLFKAIALSYRKDELQ